MTDTEINARLLGAHDANDAPTIVTIYKTQGDAALANGDTHSGCFYLTHAYVFALEAGLPVAKDIHTTLKQYGREE